MLTVECDGDPGGMGGRGVGGMFTMQVRLVRAGPGKRWDGDYLEPRLSTFENLTNLGAFLKMFFFWIKMSREVIVV